MTLDTERHEPIDPNELIRYGMGEAVRLMTDLARAEAVRGDGRAMRILARLVESAGLSHKRAIYQDDGV